MIDFDALFKISYGLYIVSSGDKQKGNGFISNTVFQVTAEPPKFASCCNKDNYTTELIKKSGAFSVSVLHTQTPADIYGRFGYRSGKDFNKMEGLEVKYGKTGVPIVLNDVVACLEFKLVETFDVGTHWIFIGELIQSELINDTLDPISYSYYRNIRKGVAPKNAPTYVDKSKLQQKKQTAGLKKYKCTACGFIYDETKENIKFSELTDDWQCPVCGSEKEDFINIE